MRTIGDYVIVDNYQGINPIIYVSTYDTGQNTIDVIHLPDGKVLALNDEYMYLYEDEIAFKVNLESGDNNPLMIARFMSVDKNNASQDVIKYFESVIEKVCDDLDNEQWKYADNIVDHMESIKERIRLRYSENSITHIQGDK